MTKLENMVKEEVRDFFYSKFRTLLNKNEFYRSIIKDNSDFISFIDSKSTPVYFLSNILYFKYNAKKNHWSIDAHTDLDDGALSVFLGVARKVNSLESVLRDILDIVEHIKSLILANSSSKIVKTDFSASFLKKAIFAFELKKKISKEHFYKSYITSYSQDIHLIVPQLGIILTPAEFFEAITIYKEEDRYPLPYKSGAGIRVFMPLKFKDSDLDKILYYFKLRSLFQQNTVDVETSFNKVINRKAGGSVFERRENPLYYQHFIKANPEIDIEEVMYLSKSVQIKVDELGDFNDFARTGALFISVLKTQSGIYYLKDDYESIGYITLDELYKNDNSNSTHY